MDDSMEMTIPEVAGALGIEERTVRYWIKPRNKNVTPLEVWVPFNNRKFGYRTTAGDVRRFLQDLEKDKGHALKKFEAWAAQQDEETSP